MGTFKKYKILIIFSVAIINVNHFKKNLKTKKEEEETNRKKKPIFKKKIFFKEKYETKSKTSISGDVLFTNTAAMHDRYVQNQPIST